MAAFLSPDSAIGFGAADYLELALALALGALVRVPVPIHASLQRLAQRTRCCMLLFAALPIALRLALLPHCSAPPPSGADDFSYLLLADTLRHLRLANPPHALPEFFAQIFVLERPTYSSIFPLGSGLFLALGWAVLGHAWAGVLIATGAFCALCYWMLRGWTTPGWAFLGGLLAVIEFGPLNYWMNCYWGGTVSALAGCLVFGALPRLRERGTLRDALLLGSGLALQLLARPFEFLITLLCVLVFFARTPVRRPEWRALVAAAAVVSAGGALMLLHNRRVTGSWTTMPYALYRYEYGVPATFTFQPNALPHHELNSEEDLDYRAQAAIHGDHRDTWPTYMARLLLRARFARFFFLAPLYLPLLAFLATLHEYRFAWVVLTFLAFALASNFYPYFYPHYLAAITCLCVLASVVGLERLSRARMATGVVFVCFAQFAFWYGVHARSSPQVLSGIARYETWDFINYGDFEGRILINEALARQPDKQLVFVRYGPQHAFHEWVHNAADIDSAHVVWAHDLGALQNANLRAYYPSRHAWLLEPDKRPPKLSAYPADVPRFESVP
ncbi:MAG: hypothetical protein JO091_09910 [Acidobacteriaceae bacterium]|nr:hypothetical protein [Acidobacteriaceae bacterium]